MDKKYKEYIVFFILIFAILSIAVFATFLILELFDNHNDRIVCQDEFQIKTGLIADSSFANDDFHILNFGKNIHCDVFWKEEEGWLAEVNFISGSLTLKMVDDSRYW